VGNNPFSISGEELGGQMCIKRLVLFMALKATTKTSTTILLLCRDGLYYIFIRHLQMFKLEKWIDFLEITFSFSLFFAGIEVYNQYFPIRSWMYTRRRGTFKTE
jgi:hypothetical protein